MQDNLVSLLINISIGGIAINILWGSILIVIFIIMFIAATVKSDFIIYKLLIARTKLLFKDYAYEAHQVFAVLGIIFGLLLVFGVIPTK